MDTLNHLPRAPLRLHNHGMAEEEEAEGGEEEEEEQIGHSDRPRGRILEGDFSDNKDRMIITEATATRGRTENFENLPPHPWETTRREEASATKETTKQLYC